MRAFGVRLRITLRELRGDFPRPYYEEEPEFRLEKKPDPTRAIMRIIVSLIVLGAGAYTLATGSDEASKAAAGLIGTVVGYWLS